MSERMQEAQAGQENGQIERTLKPGLIDMISAAQYESSLNVMARRKLYEFAVPPIGYVEKAGEHLGIDGEIIKSLDLKGDETLVDVGCGDGGFINILANKMEHKGELIGVNDIPEMYVVGETATAKLPNVSFLANDARNLKDIDDNSADVVTALFLLYHVGHPEKALDEFERILKPGGKLMIATRCPGNQLRIWSAQREIAQVLNEMSRSGETKYDYEGLLTPRSYYQEFSLDHAVEELHKRFESVDPPYLQESPLHIPPEDGWELYKFAHYSLIHSYTKKDKDGEQIIYPPHFKDIEKALDRVVKPNFDREVEEKGYFVDYVKQGFVQAKK